MYVLIDLEHGGRSGKRFDGEESRLATWTKKTLNERKCYDTASDMYQLGVLLETQNALHSDMGKAFVRRLNGRKLSPVMPACIYITKITTLLTSTLKVFKPFT